MCFICLQESILKMSELSNVSKLFLVASIPSKMVFISGITLFLEDSHFLIDKFLKVLHMTRIIARNTGSTVQRLQWWRSQQRACIENLCKIETRTPHHLWNEESQTLTFQQPSLSHDISVISKPENPHPPYNIQHKSSNWYLKVRRMFVMTFKANCVSSQT